MSKIDTAKITEMLEFSEAYTEVEMLMLKWINSELHESISKFTDAAVCLGRYHDYDGKELFQAWIELLVGRDRVLMINSSLSKVTRPRAAALRDLKEKITNDLILHLWAANNIQEIFNGEHVDLTVT